MTPFLFFNDTPTTDIYTLSLHDALPILSKESRVMLAAAGPSWSRAASTIRGWNDQSVPSDELPQTTNKLQEDGIDRKSTRLNSSHSQISYAVFCLKKKIKMKK